MTEEETDVITNIRQRLICCLFGVRNSTLTTKPAAPHTKADWLRRTPLFADRPQQELEFFGRHLDNLTYRQGDELIREGHVPHSFHVILEGAVELRCAGRPIARLGPGDCTDYEAMRSRTPARYTARAITDVHVLVAGHAQFRALKPGVPLGQLCAPPMSTADAKEDERRPWGPLLRELGVARWFAIGPRVRR